MAPCRSSTPTAIERDLRDIQLNLDRLVQQLGPSPRHRFNHEAARSLLAAVSYKLDYLQAAVRA